MPELRSRIFCLALSRATSSLGVTSLLGCVLVAGCGGGGGNSGGGGTQPPLPTITSISVTCAADTVPTGKTNQCSATVSGTGNYTSLVSWSVAGTAGGNATVGTISTTGLYTAPATAPNPYTVVLTATSTADLSKSASLSVVVAGTIATVTVPISSTVGGTLTLPDGSSVSIAPNELLADDTVTLTEVSVPLNQRQNQLLTGTGPALYLSFSSTPRFQSKSKIQRNSAVEAQLSSGQAAQPGITFFFNFGLNMPAAGSAMSALTSFSNQAGQVFYEAISATINTTQKVATAVWDTACTSAVGTVLNSSNGLIIGAYFVAMAVRPANSPTQNLLVWSPTAGTFSRVVQCSPATSSRRVLVVVHGMLSSVEGSYTTMLQSPSFVNSVPYGAVYGIDYNWWDGLQNNGKTVAGFLDTLASTCEKGNPVDILAHSEGVPVTLSALAQDTTAKASIKNVIAVAGPTLGTPEANTFTESLGSGRYALLTIVANWPTLDMVFPPATPGGINDLLQDQFATDLATDSLGSDELATIRNTWLADSDLSNLPIIMSGGTNPKFSELQWLCTGCFGIFRTTPFDGVVGLDSAFGVGLDLSLYRIPALPDFHTDLIGDSTLTGNASIPGSLSLQLSNQLPPKLIISTSSSSTNCADSRWCAGTPSTAFRFTASGLRANSSTVNVYILDPTGTQEPPISTTSLPDGTLSWTETPTSRSAGTYGIWLYDPKTGASNSVIETICAATCPSISPSVSVNISPSVAQLEVGNQQQFTSTVIGTQSTAVIWSVNGIVGGDSTIGKISSAGLYAAPVSVPSQPTVTISAASQAKPSAIGIATVSVQLNSPSPVISSLAPASLLVDSNAQTLTINGSGFLPVSTATFNGIVRPVTFINSNQLTMGLTSNDLSAVGTYPVVVVNPAPGGGASSPAAFTVLPLFTISPSPVSIPTGSVQTFTATVVGGGPVTWSVKEGASGGSITSAGIYTAPIQTGTYHVVATNAANTSETATATVNVVAGPLYSVLHSFPGAFESAALVQGADGDLYGTNEMFAFKIDGSGNFTPLGQISSSPSAPISNLVQANDTNFYGVNSQGSGFIFKMDSSGKITTLFNFPNNAYLSGSTGIWPWAGLIQASDGNFYGTTYAGGNLSCTPSGWGVAAYGPFDFNPSSGYGCGTVFRMDSSGNETVLYAFSGQADGNFPQGSLIQGRDGLLYGTTSGGGSDGYGTIFSISFSGKFQILYSFSQADAASPVASLIQASDGYLYGTAACVYCNSSMMGEVYRVDSLGNDFTVLHTFTGPDGALPVAPLIQANDGNFYGTTWAGGDLTCGPYYWTSGYPYIAVGGCGTVFKMNTSGNITVLHTFEEPQANGDGDAPYAGLVQGKDGNLYGTTYFGGTNVYFGTIFKIGLP